MEEIVEHHITTFVDIQFDGKGETVIRFGNELATFCCNRFGGTLFYWRNMLIHDLMDRLFPTKRLE
jgi:hypothetical protein